MSNVTTAGGRFTEIPLADLAENGPNMFVDGPFGSELKVSDLSPSGIPLVRIQHIGVASFIGRFDQFVSEKKFKELSKHDVRPGDLVFAKLGDPAGRSALIPDTVRLGLIVADCVRLRINSKKVDPHYLAWAVNSPAVLDQIGRSCKGSTRQRANLSDFKKILVPITTSRSEQKRISELLNQADHLRRVRRYALELSDTFLPAAFLKLFGNPIAVSNKWNAVAFDSLGTLDRGRSRNRPRNAPHLYGGPYPFIQTGDVANARGYIRSHSQTYSEEGLKQSKIWPAGTLCITIAANIADTAILTYPACFPDSIVGFIPGSNIRIEFVQFWLQFLQETLERTAPEVAQKNINLEILRELRCPVPPLELQQRFVSLVERHERLRATQREALRQAEHLFQTLLHRAFTSGL